MSQIMQCPKCSYERKTTDTNPDWECPSCGIAYSKFKKSATEKYVTRYIPNVVPRTERLVYLVLSILLVFGGANGLSNDDLIIVGKGGRVYHLHGKEAAIMYGAYIFAALCLVTMIADHYDKRDNESVYWFISRCFGCFAALFMTWSLFAK
jgi:hypothetical protein